MMKRPTMDFKIKVNFSSATKKQKGNEVVISGQEATMSNDDVINIFIMSTCIFSDPPHVTLRFDGT